MRHLALCLLVACTNNPGSSTNPPGDDTPPEEREHDARFHGWWAVEQNMHALYEVTFYEFNPDGQLGIGQSVPANCTGHLAKHCVTGSVANCIGDGCQSDLTCVFGNGWWSTDANHLHILGTCSDAIAREIVIELEADQSTNSEWAGAGGTLLSVDGSSNWSHDNWEWGFRKCPNGPTACMTPL